MITKKPIKKSFTFFSKTTLLVLFFIFGLKVHSQTADERIEHIINETNKDTNRVIKLYQLAHSLQQNNLQGSMRCNQRLLKELQEIQFPKGYGYYYYIKGTNQIFEGNYKNAVENYHEAIKVFDETKDLKMKLKSLRYMATALNFDANYNGIIVMLMPIIEKYESNPNHHKVIGEMMVSVGGAKMRLQEYDEAIQWYQKANVLFQKVNHHFGTMQTHSEIGLLYFKLKNYPKALQYFEQSEEVIRIHGCGSDSTNGLLYAFKARVFLHLKRFKEAQYFQDKSITIHQKLKNQSLLGLNHKIHLELLYAQKKYEQVILNGQKYLQLHPKDISLALDFNYRIGTSHIALQQWDQAEEKLILVKKAFDLHDVVTDIKYTDAVDALLKVHQSKGHLAEAYNSLSEVTSLKIENLEKEKESKIQELIIQYDVLNKDLKIKQNKIEAQKKEIQIQKQNNYLLYLSAIVIFVIMILLIVFWFYTINRKKNTQLQEQQLLIQNVNQELRSSLFEKEILLKEIHHRVKNNLQLVMSLLNIQAKQEISIESFLSVSQSRIQSMAMIHENLYREDNLSQIKFKSYLKDLYFYIQQSYQKPGQTITLNLETPDVSFDVQTAIPLGLILNEVICNAFKHAFPDQIEGQISIFFKYTDNLNAGLLIIKDNGIGIEEGTKSEKQKSYSLGLQLIKLLAQQMGGNLNVIKGQGTTFELNFKLGMQL